MQSQQKHVLFKRYTLPETSWASRTGLNMRQQKYNDTKEKRKGKSVHLLAQQYQDRLNTSQYRVSVYQATVRPGGGYGVRGDKRRKWKRRHPTVLGARQGMQTKQQGRGNSTEKGQRKTVSQFVNLTKYKANLAGKKDSTNFTKIKPLLLRNK